ncbi:MAG: hypothetical protein WEK74_13485, partial [Hydrogenophaga sp.]
MKTPYWTTGGCPPLQNAKLTAMRALLTTFSWQELRHHPWRNASAVVAVMLGVALALAVHLINASALAEFASAVSTVNGQPDRELRARQGLMDDRWLERAQTQAAVAQASPVLSLRTQAMGRGEKPLSVELVGVDALSVAAVSPALMPVPSASAQRLDLFA